MRNPNKLQQRNSRENYNSLNRFENNLPNIYNRPESSSEINNNDLNNNNRTHSTTKGKYGRNNRINQEIINQRPFQKKLFNYNSNATTSTKTDKRYKNFNSLNLKNTGRDPMTPLSQKKENEVPPSLSDFEFGQTAKYSKHIYGKHFGNEKNCPICKEVRLRGKISTAKKLLPLINKNKFREICKINRQSSTNKINKKIDKDIIFNSNCHEIIKKNIFGNNNKNINDNPIKMRSGLSGIIKENRASSVGRPVKDIDISNYENQKANNDDEFSAIHDYFNS